MSLSAGFDVGGTQLKFGLVDERGNPHFKDSVTTPSSIEKLMAHFRSLWSDLKNRAGAELKAAGFGFPGIFDLRAGKILQSPNYPGLDRFDLLPALSEIIDVPFRVDNDANLAAFGEYAFGAGRGAQSLIFLTLGTGVGSGIILNGELWHGSRGYAGELGHVTVNPEGEWCKCGNQGCLETEASGPAVVRNYWRFGGNRDIVTAEDVFRNAAAGDEKARRSFAASGKWLGIGLAAAINLLNPDKVILGGGVMAASEYLLPFAVEEVRRRTYAASFECCVIGRALLGNDAGFLGAAAWGRHGTGVKI